MKIPLLATALLCTSILPGCAYDEGKGDEEDALGAYESKTDSFRNPTEHGALIFGVAQSAKLAEDELFHSWDFELTGDASIRLATQLVTANLDTVMYLYKRDLTTGRFGSYKFKNDDASGDTVASELSKELSKGQYRVLVKGFKSSLRGSFEVLAECEGPGCASSSCDIATFAGLPDFRDDSCGELFSAALGGAVTGQSGATVILDERCTLPESASAAVEYYVAYFGGLDQFNDSFNFGSPGDPVDVEVTWDVYNNGTSYVQVDGGGDEAALDFLMDAEGEVIAHYQHNQSPDFTLYCDGGEEFIDDDECFFEYVENFPHASSDERTQSKSVTGADAQTELERPAFLAYQAYAAELGLAADVAVTVDATVWDLGGFDAAGRVRVATSGQEDFVYELMAASNTQWQFTVKRGSKDADYDCVEL